MNAAGQVNEHARVHMSQQAQDFIESYAARSPMQYGTGEKPELDRLQGRFSTINEILEERVSELEAFADRLAGTAPPKPCGVEQALPDAGYGGVAGILDGKASQAIKLLDRLQDAIAWLNKIA